MNELTEQLKLSKIPDAEIGGRVKVVIYFFVHLYVLTIVIGRTLNNLIDTPLKTLKNEWHGLTAELQKWTRLLSSEQQKTTEPQSNLQHSDKESTALNSSENSLFKTKSSAPMVITTRRTANSKKLKKSKEISKDWLDCQS